MLARKALWQQLIRNMEASDTASNSSEIYDDAFFTPNTEGVVAAIKETSASDQLVTWRLDRC